MIDTSRAAVEAMLQKCRVFELFEEADLLSALADERDQARAWQPIETAPKDGTLILLCDARIKDLQLTASYGGTNGLYVWEALDGPTYHRKAFTHWQPLPPPPAASQPEQTKERGDG